LKPIATEGERLPGVSMEGYMSARTVNPPTDKSKREAGAVFGAGLFIYGKMDVETFATLIQRNGFETRN